MSDRFAEDVTQIAELFKAGGWSELRVEAGGFNLLLSSDAAATFSGAIDVTSVPSASPAPPTQDAIIATSAKPLSTGTRDASWQTVAAPNLGTFYRSPKPGTPPFVNVGDQVTIDTEICLLEVMKLFTSVTAGVAGVVREITAADAELVEGGQPLFYIEPQGA